MDTALPSVIALCSPAPQCGKSSVANLLTSHYGYECVKFAGPLKAMARGLFEGMGFDAQTIERMVEGDLKEQPIPGLQTATPRHFLQTLGTDWGREAIQKDLWVRTAVQNTARILARGGRVVIDDCRYPNELAAIREIPDHAVIYVARTGVAAPEGSAYEGLIKRSDADIIIVNDGTIEQLEQAVLAILK